MNKAGKTLLISLLAISLVASGGAALDLDVSFDTIIDLGCSINMVNFLQPACTPVLYDDIIDASASEVQKDIFAKVSIYQDNREQIITEQKSRINQTYGMAMSQAKLDIIKLLNNGTGISTAKERGLEHVDEFYAQQQKSLLAYKNREVMKFNETVLAAVRDTSGLSMNNLIKDGFHPNYGCGNSVDNSYYEFRGIYLDKKNITLADGEEQTSYGVKVKWWQKAWDYGQEGVDDTTYFYCTRNYTAAPVTFEASTEPMSHGYHPMRIADGDGNISVMFRPTNYTSTWQQIEDARTRARDNVIKLGENIYDQYTQNDNLSVSGVLGPLEELKLAATNYEETGYYAYLATSLEQMGLASNQTSAFKVKWWPENGEPQTAYGQLFVNQGAYNGTIQTGKNYTVGEEAVWFVHETQDGNATTTEFHNKFRVLEMRNPETGEQLNQTSLQSTKFRTSTAEDLKKQLEQIKNNQQELMDDSNGNFGGAIGDAVGWLTQTLNNVLPSEIPNLQNNVVAVLVGIILLLVLYIA